MLDVFTSEHCKVKIAQKARKEHFSFTSSSSITVVNRHIVVRIPHSSDLNGLVKRIIWIPRLIPIHFSFRMVELRRQIEYSRLLLRLYSAGITVLVENLFSVERVMVQYFNTQRVIGGGNGTCTGLQFDATRFYFALRCANCQNTFQYMANKTTQGEMRIQV